MAIKCQILYTYGLGSNIDRHSTMKIQNVPKMHQSYLGGKTVEKETHII